MVIEEEEEVQTKGVCNLFNKIIAENFPNLKKELSKYRTSNRLDLNRASPWHIIVETASTESKDIKGCKKKQQ
jgi:hypothetical protein